MISKDDIKKLAGLARIKLSEQEESHFAHEIDNIVGYIDQIQKVSGDNPKRVVEKNRNVLREDNQTHESGAYTKEILAEAPMQEDGYVKVKKIL